MYIYIVLGSSSGGNTLLNLHPFSLLPSWSCPSAGSRWAWTTTPCSRSPAPPPPSPPSPPCASRPRPWPASSSSDLSEPQRATERPGGGREGCRWGQGTGTALLPLLVATGTARHPCAGRRASPLLGPGWAGVVEPGRTGARDPARDGAGRAGPGRAGPGRAGLIVRFHRS
jgi:hypothetical protein